MSTHKSIVEKYIFGLERGDYPEALSYMADDVVFELVGQTEIRGKDELGALTRNYAATTSGTTRTIDRLIEEGDRVVVVGHGVNRVAEERWEIRFCDVFTFSGDLISDVQTYQIRVDGPAPS